MEQGKPRIRIRTGARLHFGLLDMSGSTRRVDGGAGLYVQGIGVTVEICHASEQQIHVPSGWRALAERVVLALGEEVRAANFQMSLLDTIPKHVGLGSGTQTALAMGTALSEYFNLGLNSVERLAAQLGRGGTSGLGAHAFGQGGFVVDGGRAWPQAKSEMLPSRYCKFESIPPCLARFNFPDWGICILTPRVETTVSGSDELDRFRSLVPIPVADVNAQSRLVLLGLMPSILESDFEGFCEAASELNNLGLKARQWSVSDREVKACRVALADASFRGIGLSSWGPSVFGFAKSQDEARELATGLKIPESTQISVLTAQNHGAVCEKLAWPSKD
jgi:beta-ribofuranosylaminobenzene 5'-phosphate synthase